MKDEGDLLAFLTARLDEAKDERRAAFAVPLDLAKVRAYCRDRGADEIAQFDDDVLSMAVHIIRLHDPLFQPAERAQSKTWILTEGIKKTRNPAVRAMILTMTGYDPPSATLPN